MYLNHPGLLLRGEKKVWDLKMHMTFEVKKRAHNREKLAAILAEQKTDYHGKDVLTLISLPFISGQTVLSKRRAE